jgi:spore coat polysaccharide biosynthesis protein SpsF
VFTFAALERAWREAREPHQREHVTPYIYQHPELFKLHAYKARTDLSAERWTLDTPEDWTFLEGVFRFLPPDNYSRKAVLTVLSEHPELRHLNADVQQKPMEEPPGT